MKTKQRCDPIQCENAKTIREREFLERSLYRHRRKYRLWFDSKGRISNGQPLPGVLINLFRDFSLWPFIYWKKSRDVAQLNKTIYFQAALNSTTCILFLRTDHWFNIMSGGSVGHLAGVIHGLKSFGYEAHVVSTDRLKGIQEDEHFHLCEPVYGVGGNIPNFPEILYNDQLLSFISEHWLAWTPSFIYQRYSLGNYTGVELKKKYGVPYICEYNGSFSWMARHWGKGKILHERLVNRIELLNLHAADLVVVISQAMKDELLARGINGKKILVNPNAADPKIYSPNIDGSDVRSQYKLNRRTVAGFIGTFGQWHGAEILAKAFGMMLQRFPEYRERTRLLMIGDGVTMPLVKRNLEKFGVTENSVLTGLVPQEEGPKYLAACDVLVASHKPNPDGTPFFGSPTKVFEYMAMGKGIVASDLDQIGEILKHDCTAWLVKPGDIESLMMGLKTLIDDKPRRERLGKAAREELVAKYTWKEHTRKIIEKLKERCA